MNSELEAIMRRRRKGTDTSSTGSGSGNNHNNPNNKSTTTNPAGAGARSDNSARNKAVSASTSTSSSAAIAIAEGGTGTGTRTGTGTGTAAIGSGQNRRLFQRLRRSNSKRMQAAAAAAAAAATAPATGAGESNRTTTTSTTTSTSMSSTSTTSMSTSATSSVTNNKNLQAKKQQQQQPKQQPQIVGMNDFASTTTTTSTANKETSIAAAAAAQKQQQPKSSIMDHNNDDDDDDDDDGGFVNFRSNFGIMKKESIHEYYNIQQQQSSTTLTSMGGGDDSSDVFAVGGSTVIGTGTTGAASPSASASASASAAVTSFSSSVDFRKQKKSPVSGGKGEHHHQEGGGGGGAAAAVGVIQQQSSDYYQGKEDDEDEEEDDYFEDNYEPPPSIGFFGDSNSNRKLTTTGVYDDDFGQDGKQQQNENNNAADHHQLEQQQQQQQGGGGGLHGNNNPNNSIQKEDDLPPDDLLPIKPPPSSSSSFLSQSKQKVVLRSRRLSSHDPPVPPPSQKGGGDSSGSSSNSPCSPTSNPLTGNLLVVCRRDNNSAASSTTTSSGGGGGVGVVVTIDEIDANHHGEIVASTAILSTDVHRKISAQYGVSSYGIANVLTVAAGVHKQQGRSRVRVATIVDVFVMCSSSTMGGSMVNNGILRVLAIWQWGYAPGRPIALQAVITLPNSSSSATFSSSLSSSSTSYDPKSLCVADGLCFLAGRTTTGAGSTKKSAAPCVYVAKPHVRDTWSTTIIPVPSSTTLGGPTTTTTTKSLLSQQQQQQQQQPFSVTALAVTYHPHRMYKYLAVALSDGSLSVWTYELAIATNKISSGGGASSSTHQQKLLVPFCRLEGASALYSFKESLFLNNAGNNPESLPSSSSSSDNANVAAPSPAPAPAPAPLPLPEIPSYCTHLSWLPPNASASSMLLLAAAFTNGVAIYHVALPLIVDVAAPAADTVSELSAAESIDNTMMNEGGSTGGRKNFQKAAAAAGGGASKQHQQSNSINQVAMLRPIAGARAATRGLVVVEALDSSKSSSGSSGSGGGGNSSSSSTTTTRTFTPFRTMVSWVELGPRVAPAVALMFELASCSSNNTKGISSSKKQQQQPNNNPIYYTMPRLVLGVVDLPVHGDSKLFRRGDTASRSLHILWEGEAPLHTKKKVVKHNNNIKKQQQQQQQQQPYSSSSTTTSTDLVTATSLGSMAVVHRCGYVHALSPGLVSTTTTTTTSSSSSSSNSNYIGTMEDEYFSSIRRPTSSAATGLTKVGSITCPDSAEDHNGILHVFSVLQCQRKPYSDNMMMSSSSSSSTTAANNYKQKIDWTTPVLRHWLCRTTMGDSSDKQQRTLLGSSITTAASTSTTYNISDTRSCTQSTTNNMNMMEDDGVVTGGCDVSVICELTCGENESSNLVPDRLVRQKLGTLCAVLFGSSIGSHKTTTTTTTTTTMSSSSASSSISSSSSSSSNGGNIFSSATLSPDPIAFALIDVAAPSKKFELYYGRDITFLANEKMTGNGAIVLSEDGSAIYEFTRNNSSNNNNMNNNASESVDGKSLSWKKGKMIRPIKGVSSDGDYISARRIHWVSFGSKCRLVVVGMRARDRRACILAGPPVTYSDTIGWKRLSKMIPDAQRDSIFWLGEGGEAVLTLRDLPVNDQDSPHLAVLTQARVLILSDDLKLLAQIETGTTCNSLVTLGGHCVAFCASASFDGKGDAKIKYLTCLDEKYSKGVLATLPSPRFGYSPFLLMAVRPDRIVYLGAHNGIREADQGEDENLFLMPIGMTHPAFVLEPMVANMICEKDGGDKNSQAKYALMFRGIIEKFGRKVSSFPHGDSEGIGGLGTGISSRVLEILHKYGCEVPATILLAGRSPAQSSTSQILPPWVPMSLKAEIAPDLETALQVLSNGDEYLTDYIKSPDVSMISTLPRFSDASGALSEKMGFESLRRGDDIMKTLRYFDLAGTESSEDALVQLVLSRQLDPAADITPALRTICESGKDDRGQPRTGTAGCMAALALHLLERQENGKVPVEEGECGAMSDEQCKLWMRQLAPSLQRGRSTKRTRARLIGENALISAVRAPEERKSVEVAWNAPVSETRHIWTEGPMKNREKLLLLDKFEDWLGRRRPVIMGKEGAELALERGEKTLADILYGAGDAEDGIGTSCRKLEGGWAEDIGTGRTDEDNLSAYFRMSEGADEDSTWRSEGLADLTKYQHKAIVVGVTDSTTLEATTSSVDEGEAGKAKLLYDLVYGEEPDRDRPSAVLIEAVRGGSLDVGMLHAPAHDARKRCCIEFWYHLPESNQISEEIVLARRSLSAPGDDMSKLCVASDREQMLWELVVLPTGALEFRSSGGSSFTSYSGIVEEEEKEDDASGSFNGRGQGLVSYARKEGYGGWNHACLNFSSRGLDSPSQCTVSLFMKGDKVNDSTVVSLTPTGMDESALKDYNIVDELMERTALVFGINPPAGFRLTELRVWSCERDEEDIKMMMYEYLRAAETKKKFKVKIRNKRGVTSKSADAPTTGGGGLLAPPPARKTVVRLGKPEERRRSIPKNESKDDAEESKEPKDGFKSKDTTFDFSTSFTSFSGDLANNAFKDAGDWQARAPAPAASAQGDKISNAPATIPAAPTPSQEEVEFFEQMDAVKEEKKGRTGTEPSPAPPPPSSMMGHVSSGGSGALNSSGSLHVDLSLPLSRQVRSSAAAALIRGPPAARHFGGNHGGLAKAHADHRSSEKRHGVGAIAICGAEKTVIYAHDQSPPGKTYPIGASGAIISDTMDNKGSEYLCCFLAKDKRMVVFELRTKTVVVELTMTTKLNFWRYLPPQAHGHTLVFALITPIGGFHWMPLDESPRPRQVWRRSAELHGKKVISYEEGGNNGLDATSARSTVALLLASTSSSSSVDGPVEAWCIPVSFDSPHGSPSKASCLSTDVLGAALFKPADMGEDSIPFLPILVTAVSLGGSDIMLQLEPMTENASSGVITAGDILTCIVLDQGGLLDVNIAEPALALGAFPPVLCCCLDSMIVAVVRKKGLVAAYEYADGDLSLVGQSQLGEFIVDAAVREAKVPGEIEVVLLISDRKNPKDGRVATLKVSRSKGMNNSSF